MEHQLPPLDFNFIFDEDQLTYSAVGIDQHTLSLDQSSLDSAFDQLQHDQWLTDVREFGAIGHSDPFVPSVAINGAPPSENEHDAGVFDLTDFSEQISVEIQEEEPEPLQEQYPTDINFKFLSAHMPFQVEQYRASETASFVLQSSGGPAPISIPSRHSNQLQLLNLPSPASAPTTPWREYEASAANSDIEDYGSDSDNEYDPEEVTATARLAAQRKKREQQQMMHRRVRSFSAVETSGASRNLLSASTSPHSNVSSIPSSPSSSPTALRVARPRTRQVAAAHVPDTLVCSVCNKQQRCRTDYKRHLYQHTAAIRLSTNGPDWFCCGVPLEIADEYGITDTSHARTWEHTGTRVMVGGCGTTFARRDAYSRHLKAKAGTCFGDSKGVWVPGNMRRQGSKESLYAAS